MKVLNVAIFLGILLSPMHVLAADALFVSQAPTGQWWDLRQAQGCEEAAALMAVTWARGTVALTPKQARDRIVGISDWEFRNYGQYVDTSIQDTADRIIRGYLKFNDIQVAHNISVKDIAAEVYAGKVVITGINGRKLPNPHYRFPAPRHHVLVVVAYDQEKDVFTVHDPGTKFGANLHFTGPQLQNALMDYESGNGRSTKILPPAMIIFSPSE